MNPRNILLTAILLASAALIFILVLLQMPEDKNGSSVDSTRHPPSETDSFVFFDLGSDTRFNDALRKTLNERLGPDRMETWSPIDLEMHEAGFIAAHFPELAEMNRRLNINNGLDIGEHTIKVTYRYAANQNLPFYYIKLVFSDFSKRPLYFRIKMTLEGQYVIDTIREKYGTPQRINWGDEDRFTLFWKKNDDIMTISRVENRIGEPEYQIMIYYVSNLQHLLLEQREHIQKKTQEKTETGKSAF